ncbi:MAG: hypothetical protein AB1807_11960 [Pseudomonadota bacterium]
MTKMTDDELRSAVDHEVSESAAWTGSALAAERERNLAYYHGQPMGNEVPGRSQVVSWDVFEVVESALPSLLEPFFAGDDICEFKPTTIGDEAYCDQATDVINHLIKEKNDGFLVFNTWIKDGLLSKVGIVRSWQDATPIKKRERYQGLTDMQLAGLDQNPAITLLTHDAKEDPSAPGQMLHDVELQVDHGPVGIRIENVEPASFILSRHAKKMADVTAIGELRQYTRSDLVAMGFDRARVEQLSDYQAAHADFAVDPDRLMQAEHGEGANQQLTLFFGFVKVDFDGDGIAEWRRVFMAGNDILENEEVDDHEYSLWSPILLPHKIIGMALADPIVSIQDTKTSLQRQYLDSLYIANNPRTWAVPTAVNLDDLLSNRIGGVVRMNAPNMAGPLQTTLVANESLQGIELTNTVREERVGISRLNQGLDADSLNKTAAGARIADARDQRRLLMMLRIFGETGCKDLCKRLLRLTCEYQDKPGTIRLRDTWVEYDPRNWSPDMGVTVNVGLGTGDKSQTIQFLNMMGAYFQQAAPLGVVTPENVYQLGKMLLKAGNIQGADRLLTDPATNPPQPPQETPEQVLAKMELELEDKRQQGKARDAEYKRETDLAELEASTKLKLIDLQLKEKEVRIKEIELGLKNTELQMRMAEAGTAQVDGSMPNAMQLIVDLHRKLEELASAETHIVRGPDGKASHTVKVLPQQQYEG